MGLDRRIKLIALLAAAAALLVFGTSWIIDPTNEISSAGALASLLAVLAFAVILRTAAPAVLLVGVTALLTIFTARLVPQQSIQTMAAIAIVVVGIVGVLLVPTEWRWRYVALGVVIVGFHTALSGQNPETIVSVGATSAVCFLFGALVIVSLFDETNRLHEERHDLLDLAPAFISEDDWTEAERRVRELGIDDPDELRRYLLDRQDMVTDIIQTVDVIHSNPTLLATFGSPADGGRFNADRVHEGPIGAFVEQIISIITDKPLHDYEYQTTTKAGDEITLTLRSIVNRRHPGQTRVLLVAQDITDKRDSRLALERAIRMKDEFVAGVSHELRTPLAGVVGLTASVLESESLSPEDRDLLNMVADQANEMARIIEDLLVASRAHEQELVIELGPVDACAEVRSVATGRDVTVKADGSVMVIADPGRLRQVVRNLATNAARYGEPPVEINVSASGEVARIEVSDHGPPIPESERDRIFEPFQSAVGPSDRPAGSVGLGLAVSRMLARRMGGDLTYHHDGRSVFRLELPIHHELEAAE